MIRLTNQYKNLKIPIIYYFKIGLNTVFSCLEIRGVGSFFYKYLDLASFWLLLLICLKRTLIKLAFCVIWRFFTRRFVRKKTFHLCFFYENRKILRLLSSLGFEIRVSWLKFSLGYSEISAVLDKWKKFVFILTILYVFVDFQF